MLQVFKGCNQDAPLDVVLNHLPISTWGTRGVRFYVQTWHRRSCLRVEVYGYDPFRGKWTVFKIGIKYIDLARTNSEALVNNTYKINRVMLSGDGNEKRVSMGWWHLRLSAKILALLRLSANFFQLRLTKS